MKSHTHIHPSVYGPELYVYVWSPIVFVSVCMCACACLTLLHIQAKHRLNTPN